VKGEENWVQWRDAGSMASRICDTLLEGVLRVRPK
jgi:hypothetical protein